MNTTNSSKSYFFLYYISEYGKLRSGPVIDSNVTKRFWNHLRVNKICKLKSQLTWHVSEGKAIFSNIL